MTDLHRLVADLRAFDSVPQALRYQVLDEAARLLAEQAEQLEAMRKRAPDESPNPDDVREELKKGGQWLGAARNWVQWNLRDGDTLNWGSTEPVSIPFVRLWELAEDIAVAAVAEERIFRARETVDIKKVWAGERAQSDLEAMRAERDSLKHCLETGKLYIENCEQLEDAEAQLAKARAELSKLNRCICAALDSLAEKGK